MQASLERLDRGGTGKVRPGDFMAAVRQVRLESVCVRVSLQ